MSISSNIKQLIDLTNGDSIIWAVIPGTRQYTVTQNDVEVIIDTTPPMFSKVTVDGVVVTDSDYALTRAIMRQVNRKNELDFDEAISGFFM